MAISVEATVEGERQLSRKLMIVADGVDDFSQPLERIGGELQKSFQDNFSSRGGLFGGWPARKAPVGWPLLERTGEMRGNFQQEMGKKYVRLFNPTPYFGFHQSNAPRRKLPRRTMMKIDAERKTFIVKSFQEYVVSLIRSH